MDARDEFLYLFRQYGKLANKRTSAITSGNQKLASRYARQMRNIDKLVRRKSRTNPVAFLSLVNRGAVPKRFMPTKT